MNMEFDNEPTDEQLDAMLRDVQVPADLKSRLKQIPELASPSEEVAAPLQQTSPAPTSLPQTSTKTPWLSYVLAASLIGIAGFVAAHLLLKGTNTTVDPIAAQFDPQFETQEQELQMLEAEIQELEIARLESELLQLESLESNRLSETEVESMILALAPEFTIPLGGNEADVRSEMARVIKEYPNTRGAVMAEKILSQIN